MSVTINGTNGLTFNDNTTQATSPFAGGLGFRNRIINGDMRIDQRNNGAAVTINSAAWTYALDRWTFYGQAADGVFTVQRSAVAPTGFSNSALITVTTSDASIGSTQLYLMRQPIEGVNVSDLAWGTASAQPVTLSFMARSSVTGTFGGYLMNSAGNRSYPFTFAINSANTFEQKTVTIAGDTTGTWETGNGQGLSLGFQIGAGSGVVGSAGAWAAGTNYGATGATNLIATNGATFYITGVQLEKGSTATSFDYRPYGTELMLCQRYYEKSYELDAVPGSANFTGSTMIPVNTSSATTYYCAVTDRFRVQKRATPTMTFWDLNGNVNRVSEYTAGGLVRTDNRNSVQQYTANNAASIMINTQNAATFSAYQWSASAEL